MRSNNTLHLTYREYKFPEDFPLLVMHGTTITPQIDFIHFHNCVEIALIEKGTMVWDFEKEEQLIPAGNLCFIPPFFTHACYFPPQETEDVLCHYLFFDPAQLLAPLYPQGLPSQLLWYRYTDFLKYLPGSSHSEEKSIIQSILREFSAQKPYCHSVIAGLIQNLMVHLCRHHINNPALPAQQNSIPLLFPALSCIDREYSLPIDTDRLAQLCGLSKTQFLENFKKNIHHTPLQYLRNVRIHKACTLLISTELSILEIAARTGFTSLPSFNRTFHQLMGRSPQAYRNERRVIIKKDIIYAPYQADT